MGACQSSSAAATANAGTVKKADQNQITRGLEVVGPEGRTSSTAGSLESTDLDETKSTCSSQSSKENDELLSNQKEEEPVEEEPTYPKEGACNLVYEPDSSGRLVEHYSTHELEGMAVVGRWTAGEGKKIAGFKFKRNLGRNVLIGNCSAGVLGRKNYCNGYCQFVKSAKLMNGAVTLYVPDGFKFMPVEVYLYRNDDRSEGCQTFKLVPGESYDLEDVLAVGCLPKGSPFYKTETVDLMKWLHDAASYGYSCKL